MSTEVTVTENQPVKQYRYAILQETNGEECESWYYFIRYEGNEQALEHLSKQLDQVEWYIEDHLSTFDLEAEVLVSEQTAKEMTKVDLNYYSFHRKFDGKLEMIDLGFTDKQSNRKKLSRAFKILGYGKIEKFIDQEDIDPEDLVSVSEDEDNSEEDYMTSEEDDSDEDDDSDEEDEKESSKKTGKLPSNQKPRIEISRRAQIKQRNRK